jgi:hypothetical protein
MSTENDAESARETGVSDDLRKWRAVDDVDGLRMRVHRAIRAAETILYSEEATIKERLKACTVIQQSARTHLKLIESAELEERVSRLEDLLQTTNGTYAN